MTAVSLPLARDAALSRSLRGFTARAGITLLGFVRGQSLNIYSHTDRIAGV